MSGTYIVRDFASGLTNTGDDTETTEFVKVMNKTSAPPISVSFSIAAGATERLKWITEIIESSGLDWEGGTYTWEFEVKKANGNLSVVEVILRRLSKDGAKVKASKSSGAISVNLGRTGIKMGTITWNDGTQNPVSRAVDDRLEIVFRVKNASNVSLEIGSVGANTPDNELFFATPILLVGAGHIYDIIGVGRAITKVHGTIAIIARTYTHLYEILHVLGKCLPKPYDIQALSGKSISRLYDIIAQVRNSTRVNYVKQLASGLHTHVYDSLNVARKSETYIFYIMELAGKNLTKLYYILRSAVKIETQLHDTLAQFSAGVRRRRQLVREEWKDLFRIELQKMVEVSRIPILVKSKIGKSTMTEKKQAFTRQDAELLLKPTAYDSLIKRVKELEQENLNLKQKLWKLKYTGTRAIAITLTCVGGASLLISYFYSSLILTFIGLGLTLWGAVIFYVTPSRQVPEHIIYAIALYMIKALDDVLASMGYKGRVIFHYVKYPKGLTQGYVFIPYDSVYAIPNDEELAKEKIFYDDPKGLFIVAPSQGLVELFEGELNVNFSSVDLGYVQENLPKLLIEDLKLVDDLSIENKDGVMQVKIVGRSCANTCDLVNKQTQLGNNLGCPLCAALALVISKVTGKPVSIKESNVKNDSIETSYLTLDLS